MFLGVTSICTATQSVCGNNVVSLTVLCKELRSFMFGVTEKLIVASVAYD